MTTQSPNILLPAYLITGSDDLKKETALKRLHARIGAMGDLAFNFDRFTGEADSSADIVTACNTLPFASDVRLVQVDEVDRLKRADMEGIVSYLASPSETTVLALVATSVTKNTRLYKAVLKFGKTAVIDCAPIKRKDLPMRVRDMAVSHGVTMTPSAANALVDLVGEDTVAIDAELRKLALAHKGSDPVNDNEVVSLVSRTAEPKPWEFVDAFSARNARKCVMLRQRMKSVSEYALMSMCVNRVRELMTARCLMTRGQEGMLARHLGMPDWRVKNHVMWAKGYTAEELRGALASARDAERAMKSGSDPKDAFTEWYLSVISREG
jgi:DNA polymerase-3 subunit delta